jgi:hypothetical protein
MIKNALLEAKSTIKVGKKEAKKKANAYALATKRGGKGKGGGKGGKGASSTNCMYYRCEEKGYISTNYTAEVIKKTLETPKAKVAQKEKDNNNEPQHFLIARSIPNQWMVGDDWTLQNLAAKTIVDVIVRQSEQRQPETIAICANRLKMYGKDRNNLEVSTCAHFNKHKRNRTLSGNRLKVAKKALNTWYLDSGASHYITGDKNTFSLIANCVPFKIVIGDKSMCLATKKGTVQLLLNEQKTKISDVYYCKEFGDTCLLSVGELTKKGCTI